MSDLQLIRCAVCGAMNRVPLAQLQAGRKPVCGNCKNPLSLAPLAVTDETFATEVEHSTLPVLVDMWAPWCGPCRMVAPVVEELAGQMAGRLLVAKLNVDENPQTAGRFGIQSIPALLIFQNGREVDRLIGAQPKSEILRRLRQVVSL
ncbi:MAG TPA: thioredoxin [Bryobacteraceae bacterium]|nr:thioredoxin [Bryobacteraceae bacterium]